MLKNEGGEISTIIKIKQYFSSILIYEPSFLKMGGKLTNYYLPLTILQPGHQ
jgi:hypothetical protein